MSDMSNMVRINFKKGDDIRDAGLKTPETIERFDDIPYGADVLQVMDLYRPKSRAGETLPVIVSVHGGGWVYGDKERYQYYCMSLAEHGFAVVNFSYRLAPEAKFPAQLEDVNAVFTWVQDNAAKYRMDASHVFALGDSAGGHLLSLYAALCSNPDYAQSFSFAAPKGFIPSAIALNCGVYSLEGNNSDKMTNVLMDDLFLGGSTPEKLHNISAVNFITAAFPPTFLMTCTDDFLTEQPALFMPQLMKCKVPFELHFYSEGEKGLGHVFHCDMKSSAAHRCNAEECAFFKKYLD